MNSKSTTLGLIIALILPLLPAVAQVASDAVPSRSVSMVRRLNPVYPFELLLKGRTGTAEVRFTVEYSGRAIFSQVTTASDPSFGKSLVAEIESNEFIPPRINGQPQLAASSEKFSFEGEAALDPVARQVLAELRKPEPQFAAADSLDKKLVQTRKEPPVFPFSLQSDGLSGKADLEFIVDRDGRALFPRIVSASFEDFGWAAATAVTRWKFSPPIKEGKKVDARMKVTVSFDAKTFTATW